MFLGKEIERFGGCFVRFVSFCFFLFRLSMVLVFSVGAALFLWGLVDSEDSARDFFVVGVYPNHGYSAVHIVKTGGGGIAPYCLEQVYVYAESQEIKFENRFRVFSYPCVEAGVSIAWISQYKLQLGLVSSSVYGNEMYVRGVDGAGKIEIDVKIQSDNGFL